MNLRLMHVLLIALTLGLAGTAQASGNTVLKFWTMVGVDGPFLRDGGNPIREVEGGGLPWVLEEAKGTLKEDGELKIKVRGLIIPDSEPGFGFNPAPFFRAVVSCMTLNTEGEPVIENLMTDNDAEVMVGDPRNGDARIEADLDLPDPCLAPVVFVTSPTGLWFSVTGAGSLGF
ncbi:hypothetical protein [Motiliproteus sp. SC1-56]|uniref:hypothetical protein n=1 Tax=Motiliproteus sp. SC1-56 TaxID=2799565 RepID=UPI001A8F62BD|nr:hypothetical protein [Motiliproteus sp. SC1-56]